MQFERPPLKESLYEKILINKQTGQVTANLKRTTYKTDENALKQIFISKTLWSDNVKQNVCATSTVHLYSVLIQFVIDLQW